MRLPWLPFLITLAIALAVDVYIYIAARRESRFRIPAILQLSTAAAMYVLLAVALVLPMRGGDDGFLLTKMWLLFTFLSVLFPKILFVLFDLVAGFPVLRGGRRWIWVSRTGAVLAVALFLGMWWGALINRFSIHTEKVTVEIPMLPNEFVGYRIVQISDLHVGTYGHDARFIEQVVNRINRLEPDLIVFTGDVVNRRTEELEPFVNALSQLYAPDGVYSILGNHDYGDYFNWQSDEEKKANMQQLYWLQQQMGWKLLNNDSDIIRRGADSIVLIGVENIGDPPFNVYGDLKASYPDLSDGTTKILLSHNPAHWKEDIADNDDVNIALTLSGHTHAMQMELFGLSPAAFRYKHWAGLYSDSHGLHKLYVNIGLGTVGLPMRLGATPEITLITLTR